MTSRGLRDGIFPLPPSPSSGGDRPASRPSTPTCYGPASMPSRAPSTKLLHHPHRVDLVPMLDELAVAHPEDVDLPDRVPVAGRRHAHELADLGRARGESDDHAVVFRDRVLDHELRVGKTLGDAVDCGLQIR